MNGEECAGFSKHGGIEELNGITKIKGEVRVLSQFGFFFSLTQMANPRDLPVCSFSFRLSCPRFLMGFVHEAR